MLNDYAHFKKDIALLLKRVKQQNFRPAKTSL